MAEFNIWFDTNSLFEGKSRIECEEIADSVIDRASDSGVLGEVKDRCIADDVLRDIATDEEIIEELNYRDLLESAFENADEETQRRIIEGCGFELKDDD